MWNISDDAKMNFAGTINKDDLIFKLMIRQPDFVDSGFVSKTMMLTKEKKPHDLLDLIEFETINEGACVQMLHLGSYDNESESFRIMEDYAIDQGLIRFSKNHKEIYLTDARNTAPEKLKTVLRFQV